MRRQRFIDDGDDLTSLRFRNRAIRSTGASAGVYARHAEYDQRLSTTDPSDRLTETVASFRRTSGDDTAPANVASCAAHMQTAATRLESYLNWLAPRRVARSKAFPPEPLWQNAVRMRLAHTVAQTIVRVRTLRSAVAESSQVSFQRVDPAGLDEVGAFRIQHYRAATSAYLLDHLDANGLDDLDARSFVYVARSRGRIVATVRTVPAPFELDQYVPREQLQAAVGGDLDRYVEVSRMLTDPSFAGRGIGSAMLGFCGIDLMMHTRYRGYLAYLRLTEDRPEARLPGASTVLTFRIPARGSHEYAIMAGAITMDVLWRGVDRVRTISGRRTMTSQERS
jgi:GNAT superfamily N-acetyltransferase